MPVLPGIPVPGPDSGCGGGGGVGGSGGSWLACWPRWILSAAGGGAAGSTAPANGVGWPASGGSCAGCDLNGGEERGPYRANRSGGGSPYTPTRARPLLIRAPSSPQRGRKISRVKKRWPVRFREGYPLLKKHPPGVLCAISGGGGVDKACLSCRLAGSGSLPSSWRGLRHYCGPGQPPAVRVGSMDGKGRPYRGYRVGGGGVGRPPWNPRSWLDSGRGGGGGRRLRCVLASGGSCRLRLGVSAGWLRLPPIQLARPPTLLRPRPASGGATSTAGVYR